MGLIKSLIFALIAFALSGVSGATLAADVYTEKHIIYLDGGIRRGDAERVIAAAADSQYISGLRINSSGGDLHEAMKIASLVKGFRWDVTVAQGKVCVSACFFVWFAAEWRINGGGVRDDGTLLPQDMRDRWFGVVGIHRPFFRDPQGQAASPKEQEAMMRDVKMYLASEGLAQYLVDEMMARPSNDIYWLRERDIDAIGEYSPGVQEVLIAKCGYKSFTKRFEERWTETKLAKLYECINETLDKSKTALYTTYSAKLRKGWRPWSK